MTVETCHASAIGSELAEDLSDPRGAAPTMLGHIVERAVNEGARDLAQLRMHGLVLMMHATKHSIDAAFEKPVAEAMFLAFSRDVGASYGAAGGESEELQQLFATMNPVYARAAASRDRAVQASGVTREFCEAVGIRSDGDSVVRQLIGRHWSDYAATVRQFLEDVPKFCNVVPE